MQIRSAFMVLALASVAASMACSPNQEPSTVPANADLTPTSTVARTVASGTTAVTPTGTTGITGTESPTSQTAAGEQVIRVSVTNGQVNPAPAPVDVQLGRTVIIEVASDKDDEIHVHGYELTAPVTAGQPTRVSVAANIPGQFDVELHGSDQLLLILRVQ